MLDELGHPERHYAVLHVGGTNGKGSVAVLLRCALEAAGWRVGLYTSPHLIDVRERMLVGGAPIPPDAFAMWADRLRPRIEDLPASFFEATTAVALADAAARGADVAVVEVGLGGRLDATNVLDPLVSGVTQVRREHTEYLGDALEGIAREKAGIAKRGVPFIVGETDPVLRDALVAEARSRGARPLIVPADTTYEGPLALVGDHQRRNAAVAAAMLGALPPRWRPGAEAVCRGFARATLPGRYQRHGPWLFDVAHNPAGVHVLCETLRAESPPRPLHALVGILADKDWEAMITLLLDITDALWVTDPPTVPRERRWALERVGERFGAAVRVVGDFDRALRESRSGAATVLVCGSFHTVGDAMARLPGCAPLG